MTSLVPCVPFVPGPKDQGLGPQPWVLEPQDQGDQGLWHLVLYPVPFVPGPKDQGPVGPGQVRPKYRAQGQRVRTVQELLGHKDVRTTMIYTPVLSGVEGHVLNRGALAVRSPLD